MPLSKRLVYFSALAIFLMAAANLAAQESISLAVRKVELYKNGIGYFEHLGQVKGSQSVEIVLPSSQLNDVLKSLTVLDLGSGQITGVNYGSTAPLNKRLSELPVDLNSAEGIVDFLRQIRGAGVEIRAPGGVVTGRLMGAEIKLKTVEGGATVQTVEVNIFNSNGEVRQVELESAGALKLTEPSLASDLSRYYELVNTSHQRDIRTLNIQTSGNGERQLFVSYISEAPIWKTTYRIVLDPKQKPILQGWAIVDNTTPLDWMNVNLSLVSGAPISFVQNLSQPLYGRRPVVPLPEGYQVNPQVSEATIEEEKPTEVEMGSGMASGMVGGVVAQAPTNRAQGRAVQKMAMAETATLAAPAPLPSISDAVRQQVYQTAQAQAVGEQFEYKLRQPVTIRRNESALLPILQSNIEIEKTSLFGASGDETHPRLALWLKNSTGMTLDGGAVTIIDSNAFAGEGIIETIQPAENRLLSYAVDLGTTISTNMGSERSRVQRVQLNRGVLRLTSKSVEKKTYKIRNNNDSARTIVLEHPLRNGWTLVSSVKPVETSANYYRFRVEAKPKTTVDFVVQEEYPLENTYSVTNLTPEQIAVWVRERSLDSDTEKALQSIVAKKNEINAIAKQIETLTNEQSQIFADQERIRNNVQRLGQTPEEATLRQRYIKQLSEQENRLEAVRTERQRLETSRDNAQKQLDDLIQNISLDKKIE
jgi:hypothetical protein